MQYVLQGLWRDILGLKIALAGNPNCGKTTLFNALTGSNQFVGNWPGVTVEKKEGKLKGHNDVTIMDLPGIYSLSPYTLEEVVARNYLINERPDAILNIVDGTNIERNLYLSTQIMELGIPVVMAVNMIDIMEKTGNKVHIDKLSKKLGCEVVEISALKGTGIKEAADKAVKAAKSKNASEPVHKFDEGVESVIDAVKSKLTDIDETQRRFFAIKLLEKDDIHVPATPGGTVTNSQEAPFSDKLMLYCTYLLSNFGLGGQGFGAAFSMRHDLNLKSGVFAKDVYGYAREGVELMIANNWMEEPPHMDQHDDILN